MNIFITSLSLLLILSLGSGLFWKEALSSSFSFRAIKGTYEASRSAKNSFEKKQFGGFKKDTPLPSKKKKGQKGGKKPYVFHSHRLENPPIAQGRLAVLAIMLLEQQSVLKPILYKLLLELYGHTEWFDEKIFQRIIDKISSAKGDFDKQSFISYLDEQEYKIWYLMSKGTQNYDLSSKQGYPPLEDYIDFTSRPIKHTCNFPFASFPLIKAIFGEEVAREILKIEENKSNEKKRRRFCLKRELLDLIKSESQSGKLNLLIEDYCSFSGSAGKRSFVQGEEEKSGIVIRREAPL